MTGVPGNTLIFIAVLIAGSCAPSLSGILVTRSGDPVISNEASVNITPLDRKSSETALAVVPVSDSGEFQADLRPGSYLVESFVPDYSVVSQRVVVNGDSTKMRMVLERLPESKPQPVGPNMDVDSARGAGGVSLMPPHL